MLTGYLASGMSMLCRRFLPQGRSLKIKNTGGLVEVRLCYQRAGVRFFLVIYIENRDLLDVLF